MSTASLSVESAIRERLCKLGCAENAFALFNCVVGRTRFFEAMFGKPGKHFSHHDAERLLEVIKEMEGLEMESDAAINWNQTERVLRALVVRRIERIGAELDRESADAANNQLQ
jgi:hypothetical protein